MNKTRKSIAKKFKVTGSGKIMRRSPGMRHNLSKQSVKQKRRKTRDKLVSPSYVQIVRKSLLK